MKPIVSHAVQIIIPKFYTNGEVEVVVMPYTKKYGTPDAYSHVRLPTETGKFGESVIETAIRGTNEEVAKNQFLFEVEPVGVAYAEILPDENNPDGSHAKIAYVMTYVEGELRDFGKPDDDDPDEYHGPVDWVEIQKLLTGHVDGYKILGSHGKALCAFLKIIASSHTFKSVAERYYNTISRFRGIGLKSELERTALREYIER